MGISSPSAKREHDVDQNVPCKLSTSMDDGSLDKAEGDLGGWSTHNMRLLSKVCEEIEKSSFSAVYASKAKKIPYKQHAMGAVDAPDAPYCDDWMELQAEREAVGVQEEEGSRPLMVSSTLLELSASNVEDRLHRATRQKSRRSPSSATNRCSQLLFGDVVLSGWSGGGGGGGGGGAAGRSSKLFQQREEEEQSSG